MTTYAMISSVNCSGNNAIIPLVWDAYMSSNTGA